MPDERTNALDVVWQHLLEDERLLAPPLMWAEATAALHRASRRGRIRDSEAIEIIQDLLLWPIAMFPRQAIYTRALELCYLLDLQSAYDAQYLAVAQLEGCPLATLDGGLLDAARRLGVGTLPL